jgi:multiple sugar transport system permease protein
MNLSVKKSSFSLGKLSTRALIYLTCISLAVFFLFPIFWTMLTSIKPPAEASASPTTYLPTRITLDNYQKLMNFGAGLLVYTLNSFMVAVITVIGTIILSTLGGYGFARFKFPLKNALFVIILATMMIPFQSILTPLYIVLRTINLHNSILGLGLVYITFQLPFGLFLMRNTFETVPIEIEEAALMDGCSSFEMLYRIMLTLVRPGIITVGIYAFLNAWNEFLAALIFMNQDKNFTLPVMLVNVRSGYFGIIDWGALQAGVTVAILPCIFIFLLLQRYYMQGMMGGAVKG